MSEHHLKTISPYFEAVRDGEKTFELRKADRTFKPGDLLYLEHYDLDAKKYTGAFVLRVITYIYNGPGFGLEPNFVCLGIRPLGAYERKQAVLSHPTTHIEGMGHD